MPVPGPGAQHCGTLWFGLLKSPLHYSILVSDCFKLGRLTGEEIKMLSNLANNEFDLFI